jgi:hypothetical protein
LGRGGNNGRWAEPCWAKSWWKKAKLKESCPFRNLFNLQVLFHFPNYFEFKPDLKFARFLIAKINLMAHNNTKESYATNNYIKA